MEVNETGRRVLRKRRKLGASPVDGLASLLDIASCASRIIVFSGSGLSADSGAAQVLSLSKVGCFDPRRVLLIVRYSNSSMR